MPSATTLIQRTKLTSAQSSVSFTSIPSTYQDLRLVVSLRSSGNSGGDFITIQFNGDTGANYTTLRYYSSNTIGTNSTTYGHIGNHAGGTSVNTVAFALSEMDILGYKSTTTRKSWIYENFVSDDSANLEYFQGVGNWSSTSAITSIVVAPANASNWESGSTFTLWGISS